MNENPYESPVAPESLNTQQQAPRRKFVISTGAKLLLGFVLVFFLIIPTVRNAAFFLQNGRNQVKQDDEFASPSAALTVPSNTAFNQSDDELLAAESHDDSTMQHQNDEQSE